MSGIDQDFRGANNYRPNVIGDVYGDKNSVTSYLSKTNVVIPTDSEPAVRQRGAQHRPRAVLLLGGLRGGQGDPGLQEHHGLQFRIEAFNLFNRSNFRAPNTNRSSAAFGTITPTWDARQIQLGVKFMF